jgi:capsular exopolysaccharide synthesis family protein
MGKPELTAYERYRVLRSRILEIMKLRQLKSLLVTSAGPTEGKTTVSLNLAVALAQVKGMRVLLVDGDLRKPGIGRLLGLEPRWYLEDYLRGEVGFDEVVTVFDNGVAVIPSSGSGENTVELIESPRMKEFVDQSGSLYDIVIYDSSPLLPVADSRVVAGLIEAVVLCVRSGVTEDNAAAKAFEMVRPRVIGSILFCDKQSKGNGYYYYSS